MEYQRALGRTVTACRWAGPFQRVSGTHQRGGKMPRGDWEAWQQEKGGTQVCAEGMPLSLLEGARLSSGKLWKDAACCPCNSSEPQPPWDSPQQPRWSHVPVSLLPPSPAPTTSCLLPPPSPGRIFQLLREDKPAAPLAPCSSLAHCPCPGNSAQVLALPSTASGAA